MCRETRVSQRGPQPPLPFLPQVSLIFRFCAIQRKSVEVLSQHLCQMLSHWSCFSHNQADNGILEDHFCHFCPATHVTFLVSWTEMTCSRAGGAQSYGPYEGSPLPGEWVLYSESRWPSLGPEEKQQKSFLPQSVLATGKSNAIIITNNGSGLKKILLSLQNTEQEEKTRA